MAEESALIADASSATDNPDQNFSLGPAYALLRALCGDRIPRGELNPDSVPASVLMEPIAIAIEMLVGHRKKCQRSQCPHVPQPFWRYSTMRPETIRGASDQVHRLLWFHGDHELVATVRKSILKKHAELAKSVLAGALLEESVLTSALASNVDGARNIAATLWATKFQSPNAESLFRALVPLIEKSRLRETKKSDAAEQKQLKEAKAQLRKATKELKDGELLVQQSKEQLKAKQRAIEAIKREFEQVKSRLLVVISELERARHLQKESEADVVDAMRREENVTNINSALRRELREVQKNQHKLDLQNSELARSSGLQRRSIELLKLQLEEIPTESLGTFEFIRSEERRIKDALLISAGGDKLRAEKEWTVHKKLERAFLEAYPKYLQPKPTTIRSKAAVRLVTLGGSAEVGKSCYLLEIGSRRILVDCGVKPVSSGEMHPNLERLDHIDALLLTHAHTDHIGWVPALINKFGKFDIYCSEGTAELLPIMLEDSHNHYMRRVAGMRDRARHVRNAEVEPEYYTEEDVQAAWKLPITCKFGEEVRLPFGDLSIWLFPAGHILGASSILIADQSGRRIFMSGDFSSSPQLTVPAASWPTDIGKVDLLVLESTYGDRNHKPFPESRNELVSFVSRTVGNGGSVILAAFALGRAQELLSIIAEARTKGEIPTSAPVYVDGMIKRINPVYRKLAIFPPASEEINEVTGATERQELVMSAQQNPSIIVTTSGMMTGGPVVEYARRLLPDKRHRLVLAGYQDEGAPSRTLLELAGFGGGPRIVKLTDENEESIQFEAALPAYHVSLSSHADQAGLVEYASRLQPKSIALVHGNPTAQAQLSRRLSQIHSNAEIACGPEELDVP
jgi:Cft2 family RNA processing exonuclease